MNNTSPFSFLASIATRFQPPVWVVDEGQQRLVLFLNHVLLQEKQAQERLLRQKGRVVHIRWGLFAIDLIVTPAGLADRAPAFSKPDLVLSVAADSPLSAIGSVLAGKTPVVKIEGDVQLAAEIGWLAENLRWDAEEDLSRVIGDAPAHTLAGAARGLASASKQFLAKGPFQPVQATSASVMASVPESGKAPIPAAPARTMAPQYGTGGTQAAISAAGEAEVSDMASVGTTFPPKASA